MHNRLQKKLFRAPCAALALLLALVACGGSESPSAEDSQANDATIGSQEDTANAPTSSENESAAAEKPNAWSRIANENETFTLTSRQTVRYGLGSTWIEKSVSAGTHRCSNAFFAKDPLVGVGKQCEVRAAAVASDAWRKIGNEGESFTLSSSQTVRYGLGSTWIEKTVSAGTHGCSNAFFGRDPLVGVGKQCQVRAAAVGSGSITFKNLMVIHRYADQAGQRWVFNDDAIAGTREAFLKTWPELITELTGGTVVMENSVIVTDEPINRWDGDRPETFGVGNWQSRVGATGNYDVLFIANPAPMSAMYALGGGICCDNTVRVGWTFVKQRPDLGKYEDQVAGWTHEWLHVMGDAFYNQRLKVPNVPDVHGTGPLGYQRDSGGYNHWVGWYRDYLMRRINDNGVAAGLGEPAWSRGTLRDYLAKGGR
jgi:hypothetical protein